MQRLITLFIGFFLFFQANASHIKGGEVFYTYLGNNTYEITTHIYRDITGIPLPSSITIMVNGHPTITNLVANQDSTYLLSGCMPNVEVGIYRVTQNFGTIPANGIRVTYSECCRTSGISNLSNSGSQNIYIESELLPGPGANYASSSPRFFGNNEITGYANKTNVFNTAVFDPNPQDSIFVELVPVQSQNNQNIPYTSGYSAVNPFGNTVVTNLDPLTGLLTVVNPPQGAFVVGIKANSYRNGQLVGSIKRDMTYFISNTQDSLPTIALSNLVANGNFSQSGNSLFVEMQAGDNLSFDITASLPIVDSLSLFAEGMLFGNSIGTSGNCNGTNCASFTSTSGFIGMGLVQGTFSFQPDTSIFANGISEVNRTLLFKAISNGSCADALFAPFAVYIRVKQPGSIWAIQPAPICQGSSTQVVLQGDTSNVAWLPTTGVSNPASGAPYLSPTSSTIYTVTNLNDSTQITVNVEVDTIAQAALVDNTLWVELPNASDFDQVVWYYNGTPLAANTDSFFTPYPGDYFAYVTHGSCSAFSDTITRVNKNQVPAFGYGTGSTVYTDGTANLQFMVNGYTNTLTELALALPDSGTYKTASEPSIALLDPQANVLATGLAKANGNGFYVLDSLNVSLNPNAIYTLQVSMYAGNTIFSKPSVIPYTEPNGVVTVLNAAYMSNGTAKSDAYPPFILGITNGIGIDESFSQHSKVYPNPAKNVLVIETDQAATLLLYNVSGQLVRQEKVIGKQQIDISNLQAGVYMLELKGQTWQEQQKIIVQ